MVDQVKKDWTGWTETGPGRRTITASEITKQQAAKTQAEFSKKGKKAIASTGKDTAEISKKAKKSAKAAQVRVATTDRPANGTGADTPKQGVRKPAVSRMTRKPSYLSGSRAGADLANSTNPVKSGISTSKPGSASGSGTKKGLGGRSPVKPNALAPSASSSASNSVVKSGAEVKAKSLKQAPKVVGWTRKLDAWGHVNKGKPGFTGKLAKGVHSLQTKGLVETMAKVPGLKTSGNWLKGFDMLKGFKMRGPLLISAGVGVAIAALSAVGSLWSGAEKGNALGGFVSGVGSLVGDAAQGAVGLAAASIIPGGPALKAAVFAVGTLGSGWLGSTITGIGGSTNVQHPYMASHDGTPMYIPERAFSNQPYRA